MRRKNSEALRRRIFLTNEIQGLFSSSQSLLSFWDLKVKVTLSKFSKIEIEGMKYEIS